MVLPPGLRGLPVPDPDHEPQSASEPGSSIVDTGAPPPAEPAAQWTLASVFGARRSEAESTPELAEAPPIEEPPPATGSEPGGETVPGAASEPEPEPEPEPVLVETRPPALRLVQPTEPEPAAPVIFHKPSPEPELERATDEEAEGERPAARILLLEPLRPLAPEPLDEEPLAPEEPVTRGPRHARTRVPRVGRTNALVLALYAIAAIVLFSPISPLDETHLPAGPINDPVTSLWYLAWFPYALVHGLNPLHSNFLDYPTGFNVAANSSAGLLSLIGWPITATLGPVAAYNLLLRLAFFASAGSMYGVLRTWCRRPEAAALGGLLYAFGPFFISQAQGSAHLYLVFAPLPPLIAKAFYELVVATRWERRRAGAVLGLFCGLQALVSLEVLSQLVVLGVLAAVLLGAVYWRGVRERLGRVLTGTGYALVVFVLIGGFEIYWAFLGPDRLGGTINAVATLQANHADLLGLIYPTSHQFFAPDALASTANSFVGGNFTENGAYVGIPILVLLVGLVVSFSGDRRVLGAFALGVVAFVLSLGNRLTIDATTQNVPLPEALLSHVPLLNDATPARWALSCWLLWVVALGIGLDRLLPTLAELRYLKGRPSLVLWVFLLALGIVSLVPSLPLHEVPAAPTQVAPLLADLPAGATVLSYPYPFAGYADSPMLWQAQSAMHVRLMGGYVTVAARDAYAQGVVLGPVPTYLDAAWIDSPAPGPATPSTRALFCDYLATDGVNAVLFSPVGGGGDQRDVLALFNAALGVPEHGDAAGDLLWLVTPGSCRSS